MKKNKFGILVLGILLAVFEQTCKKEAAHEGMKDSAMMEHSMDMDMSGTNTKVVKTGNTQFAFDLMTIAEHDKMMSSMDAGEMKAGKSDTHAVMVTLMDKEKNEVIKGASVDLNVTGPDGKMTTKHLTAMSGNGMYHYGTFLDMSAKGSWKLTASTDINGEKVKAETGFDIQ